MKACYCINPSCQQPDHPHNNNAQTKYCVSCGSTLLLNNKYRVSRLLSDNSGFGVIYEAFDGFNGKILKVLQERWNNEPKAVELFKREYDVLFTLTQQNITGVPQAEAYFQYQNKEGKLFYCLVMEKVEGIDLEQWIKQDNKLHQKQALNWLREITLILDKVHQQKWFHRDIKPPNIMKRNNGELVLIDFGTAREETQTYYQNLQGKKLTGIISPGYTSNEQQNGQAVIQSDFFALGRTVVHLLTGKHPLDLYDSVNDELKWREKVENIDPIFLDLIDDLMKRLPKDRPENTQVILERLDKIEKRLQQQKPVPNPHKSKNNILRNGLIAIGGVLLLLAGYPSYIFWRYGFSATNPLLLNRDSSEFIYKTFTVQSHYAQVLSIAYSPDGQYLASSDYEGAIRIWEVETGKEGTILNNNYNLFLGVPIPYPIAYSPNGKYLASSRSNENIQIWDVQTGEEIRSFSSNQYYYSIIYSPDGKYLASGDDEGTIKIWRVGR